MTPATSKKQEQEPEIGERPSLASGDDKEAWIGRQLRAVYDETLQEPIPERFLDLLEQIDKKDPDSK